MQIKFSELSGQPALFVDYLYEYDNVKQYYSKNFRNIEQFPMYFKEIIEYKKNKNFNLSTILSDQYINYKLHPEVEKNIDILGYPNSLAILTGQQLGIFGGPLYTIYKIITAIKLSDKLNKEHKEFKFVPVFWLEGDDHDLEEVSSVNILSPDFELNTVKYIHSDDEHQNFGSVGNLKLNDTINTTVNDFLSNLRDTEFKPKINELLDNCYKPGKTFRESFKELIIELFGSYGLIVFEPQDRAVKSILSEVFKNEILNFNEHSLEMIKTSAELEENYSAQVKIKPINLFYSFEGGRYLIEPGENEYKLKGKRKKFSKDELLNLIETEPENFSPNVLLRPICQDTIFPTAFYIGGPSEIAYFAQVLPLYKYFNLPEPVLYPRSSASILEKNITSILQKNNIQYLTVLDGRETLIDKINRQISEINIDELFAETNNNLELIFDKINEKLFSLDKTLVDAAGKTRSKIENYFNEIKNKAFEAQKRKNETSLKQIDKVLVSLLPGNNLQERELNIFYFINKYGFEFIDDLYNKLEINTYEHQVIEL